MPFDERPDADLGELMAAAQGGDAEAHVNLLNAVTIRVRRTVAGRRRLHSGELTEAVGKRLVTDLSAVSVEAVSMRGLLSDAHASAVAAEMTVCDATYLTLAVRLDTQVITGDDRFARKPAEHPLLAPHVRSVKDFVSE